MIPKTIHYCWFGRNPKPKLAMKCIKSWKKYCPDYEIIEWNEDNFDISSTPLYVRQAYEAQKWAFVTDYVRLQIVYEHGGIYMDTDVELIKNLDPLLNNGAYFGFEDGTYIATGLGFGAVKGHPILKEMMADYQDIPFVLEDGTYDAITCPKRNTAVLLRKGLKQDNSTQVIDNNILVLPSAYLCPIEYYTGMENRTDDTISIHWFGASWQEAEEREKRNHRVKELTRKKRIDRIIHLPNWILMKILGEQHYNRLKGIIKGD